LERGADVDICSAAILGRIKRVRELLDSDPALANDRSTRLSPLGWASFGNQVETARELIERGARMDDGELLCAASVGHVEVGRLLIERGAQPGEIISGSGGNALHAAAAMKYSHDSRAFIDMLLDAGVDVNLPTQAGLTALRIAEIKAEDQAEAIADDLETHAKPFRAVAKLLREHGAK
jgi:ankyrin repeat protein